MNPQQFREISTGILFRMGLPACISIGILISAIMSDGTLPTWLKAGVGAISLSISGLSVFALIIEYQRQEADLKLERQQREARIPKPIYERQRPPEYKDDGETPTPEFLAQVFEVWHNSKGQSLPAVRDPVFAALRLNPSRAQAMYTRLVTWGCVVGRVQGGAPGTIPADWSHARARQMMILDRPEYGVRLGGTVSVSENAPKEGVKQPETVAGGAGER